MTGIPPVPLILAPMASITHAAFRTLVRGFGGCDLYYSEMISAEALLGGSKYARAYTDGSPDPDRLVYQIVGNSEDALAAAALRLAGEPCAGVDINMACSAPAVVRRGGGIAWMRDTERALVMISRVRRVLGEHRMSVKLRLGDVEDLDSLLTFAVRLQDAGIDSLSLHPKTRTEGAGRPARWSYVRALAQRLSIPVVGSGGIIDRQSLDARSFVGLGGAMIGRAAVQKPWLFADLARPPGTDGATATVDGAQLAARFHELLEQFQPRDFWPTRAARFYGYFYRNYDFGHSTGARLSQLRDYEQIKRDALDDLARRPPIDREPERAARAAYSEAVRTNPASP